MQCGLPLLGDSVYGVRSELICRQALHAEEVWLARLPFPTLSTGPWRGTAPYGECSTVAGFSKYGALAGHPTLLTLSHGEYSALVARGYPTVMVSTLPRPTCQHSV